ncbi:MAG: AMP-binding protein [Actinomycetia bacterium]|nr:AMP-binding protein [Actinomycetes bacterium]
MEPIWMRYWPQGVPTTLVVPDRTVAAAVSDRGRADPDRPAVIYYGRRITYGELAEQVERAAGALAAQGVAPGDRVLLFMGNTPAFVVGYLAAHALGAVVVAANPMFKADELAHELDDSGARVLVADAGLAPVAEAVLAERPGVFAVYADLRAFLPPTPFPRPHPDMLRSAAIPPGRPDFAAWIARADRLRPRPVDVERTVALIQYTSGTTGVPKGAVILQRSLLANVEGSRLWTRAGPESVHLAVLPLFHVTGMVHSFLMPLLAGGTMVLLTRFETDTFIEALQHWRATHWVGIATMNVAVVNHPRIRDYRLDSLAFAMSGGAPIPVPVLERFRELTGVTLVEGYGLSETISQVTVNPPDRPKLGSVGIPVHGVDLRITAVGRFDEELPVGSTGEIWVRGPQVMQGYFGRPEATREVLRPDGWFDTGDLGFVDEEGYLHIAGRSKELIKASGYSVFPAEVENLLYRHPAVAEAAVIGVPDPYRGETVKAVVVLKPGAAVTPEDLVAWAHANMAAYKAPRIVEIREALPKTASGKILKRILIEEERRRAGLA